MSRWKEILAKDRGIISEAFRRSGRVAAQQLHEAVTRAGLDVYDPDDRNT